LVYSPRYLFLIPGVAVFLVGMLAFGSALARVQIGGVAFDAHTMIFATLALLIGYQTIQLAIFSKLLAVDQGFVPPAPALSRATGWFTLERGLLYGVCGLLGGLGLLAVAADVWRQTGFGPMDYASTMRIVIPGMTMAALGFQTVAFSFFLGVLRWTRRREL
jgi:hypothetical protein